MYLTKTSLQPKIVIIKLKHTYLAIEGGGECVFGSPTFSKIDRGLFKKYNPPHAKQFWEPKFFRALFFSSEDPAPIQIWWRRIHLLLNIFMDSKTPHMSFYLS